MTDLESYTLQFETEFDAEREKIVLEVQEITQGKKAELFGVSRRTIINFEQGKARNYKLLFLYRMHVYGDAVI